MAGADCCGKTFLVIINIFMTFLGLVSLAGGLFLKFGQSMVLSALEPVLSVVPEQLQHGAASSSSSSSSTSLDDGMSSVSELTSTVNVAAYVNMALGLFVLIVGVAGCAGACCSCRTLLATYASVVLFVFVVKVVMLGVWLSRVVDEKLFNALEDALKTKYAGPAASNGESLLLNAIMTQLKCCGINTYKEFTEATAWDRTLERHSDGKASVFEQRIPITCCKAIGSFPTITPIDVNCTLAPTSMNSNIDTSCHEAIRSIIDVNSIAVFGTYSAVLAFEMICAAVSICLAVRAKNPKNKVHPSEDNRSTYPVQKNTETSGLDSSAAAVPETMPKVET